MSAPSASRAMSGDPTATELIDAELARRLSVAHFGRDGRVQKLVGYEDSNFLIDAGGAKSILKISRATVDENDVAYRTALLEYVASRAPELPIPSIVRTGGGLPYERSKAVDGRIVRMLSFLPGRPLAEVRPQTLRTAEQVGVVLGRLNRALSQFEHPGMHREIAWDLSRFRQHESRFEAVASALQVRNAEAIRQAFSWYENYDETMRPELPRGVIHGDANDYNLLFDGYDGQEARLSALIDFGDSVYSETINESAIALAYLMMAKVDPLAYAAAYIRGYCREAELTEMELNCLLPLIKCRLSTTLVMAAAQHRDEPDNDYYQISVAPAEQLLLKLDAEPPVLVEAILREAAGVEPIARATRVRTLLRETPVSSMLDESFAALDTEVFDLSVASSDGHRIEALSAQAAAAVDQKAADQKHVQIGRYDEPRRAYTSDAFGVDTDDAGERRTVHIGMDVFRAAGTPVRTPISGTVHGVADNDSPLDYGPTVILRHEIDGEVFFTLFGHLSRESTRHLRVGDVLESGSVVARLGTADENGGWVPHLHYQVILDLLGADATFPGVAQPSRRAVYRSLCPDPNLLLRIPAQRFPDAEKSSDELLRSRREHLGSNLSLSYDRPLHLVRGEGQWLTDADGQPFLDCVNNVCHVGHCHPRVQRAISDQASVLNTNTRYLHQNIVEYAEELVRRMPGGLDVCYFVGSGSEANDLALRMARAFTGRRGVVVLESGYHGNLGSLIELSHYKFAGPGGSGAADHVEAAAMPDPFRGKYGQDAGAYSESVKQACDRLEGRGIPAAAFLAETILSCGGQIEPPPGYLRRAYTNARASGAVCIADEVQTGFGRVGSHFWAFETQDALPDIVTMGKPMGNGHPIGAVVTTREIAAAFDNRMEYFNTYGGNPVSCAAGRAVLDVIADEGLQEHAREVGNYFVDRLEELKCDHSIIGDVRGRGLFLGIELVRDVETLEPADREARYVVNRMRDRGILLSTDGPLHNVIKIKPPMVFGRADVDRVVSELGIVLREDYVRGIGHR